jgi:pimeloyl-ACP methyl ester carboxylesterase
MNLLRKFTRSTVVAATAGLIAVTLTGAASAGSPSSDAAQPPPTQPAKPTIVLVHGAWADASSWAAVAEKLQRQGYAVDVPPNPLRGVADDATYLRAYLDDIDGPIVLAGHSYGGMVISAAATGDSAVQGLVYVDAYIPETGDTVDALTRAQPGSELAVDNPADVFRVVAIPNGGGNPDLYIRPELFQGIFAASLPARQTAVLAAGQRPLTGSATMEPFAGTPAWKTIPSWAVIGTDDRVLPAAEQRFMTARAGAHVVTVKAPHLSMLAKPDVVTDQITTAATSR